MADRIKYTKEEFLTIYKNPSALIASISSMTSMQRDLLGALIKEGQRQANAVVDDKHIFTIPISEVKTLLNIEWMNTRDIIDKLRPIVDIRVEFDVLNKDKRGWIYGSVLAGVDVSEDKGSIRFAFNPLLQQYIIKPKPFLYTDCKITNKMRTVDRTNILYCLLKDYITAYKIPELTIEKLRGLLGITPTAYSLFSIFRRSVLDPIVKEINLKSDIGCSYQLIKGYRHSWKAIQFQAWKKSDGSSKALIEPPKVDASKSEDPEFEDVSAPIKPIEPAVETINQDKPEPSNHLPDDVRRKLNIYLAQFNQEESDALRLKLESYYDAEGCLPDGIE